MNNMAKSFLNLRPGVDFPEDGTDVLPYLQALERKCMELEDKVNALSAIVNDTAKHGNLKLDARVTALETAE